MLGSETRKIRKVKVGAEVIVAATLEQAAPADIATAELVPRDEATTEQARAAERDRVREDLAATVACFADPLTLLPDVPGAEAIEAQDEAVELDADGFERTPSPDFATLFPTTPWCGRHPTDSIGGW